MQSTNSELENNQVQNFPIYGPEDVRTLLDYSGCIAAVRSAMARFSAEASAQALRSVIEIAPLRFFAVMPGALPVPDAFGAKVITAFECPDQPGRSVHRGVVVLFDRESGEVMCLADAGEVTHIRTAAASAVATEALARPDASKLTIFGCGAQAATHIRAISLVRSLEEVSIWGRSPARAAAFADKMAKEMELPVHAIADGREAAAVADIICTVTSSPTPVLLGEWVRPGTHINAVGSSLAGPVEVDNNLVVSSLYIADSRQSAIAAAAEFLAAKKMGLIGDEHIVAEIGEILLGHKPGRTSPMEVTFYKSLGHIAQDLAAVGYLHARAATRGDEYGRAIK